MGEVVLSSESIDVQKLARLMQRSNLEIEGG